MVVGWPFTTGNFDPKPQADKKYNNDRKAIKTNVAGIEISEYLPRLARIADKYSIIRSMTHGINGHETATYVMQTGRKPGGRLVYPAIGAVIGMLKGYDYGYKGKIAPYVVLTKAKGRFSEIGFLPQRYSPFVTGGQPQRTPFVVDGIVLPGMTHKHQERRRKLLSTLIFLESCYQASKTLKHLILLVIKRMNLF